MKINTEKLKKLWKLLSAKVLVFLVAAVALICSMTTLDPAPAQWQTEEVRIVKAEYQRRSSRSGSAGRTVTGYLITDDSGNRYWTESDSLRVREGETYTFTYSEDHLYRNIHGVVQGDTVYLDPDLSRSYWNMDLLFFMVPLLALLAAVWMMIREVRKALHQLRLEEYALTVAAGKSDPSR